MYPLTRSPGIALHHQISTVIEDMIKSGRLRRGDRLPGEEALRAEYQVSRVTVRRALKSLELQGLLERQAGRGTFVSGSARAAPLPMSMDAFLAAMAERRSRSKPVVKEYGYVSATPEVASALRLEPGATVLRVVRLRVAGGTPILHSTLFLSAEVGRLLKRAEFARAALTEILEGQGVRYGRIEMLTRATLAETSLAAALRVTIGSALVDVMRIGYDSADRPFEYQLLRGPSDRFYTHMTIAS